MAVPRFHAKIHKECDIAVIGGGAAGLAAAARAAALGAKVIVLEKGHEVGGSAWYAHMLRVHYSQWHREAGLEDTRDKVYEQFMKKTGGQVDGKLFRRILDANVEFIDWIIKEYDLGKDYTFGKGPFGLPGLVGTYIDDYNAKRIDTTIGPGGNGWWFCLKLLDILESSGGKILYHTSAGEIMLDNEGKVKGVLAADPGGEIEITCKSCIVAAGSFSRNKEIMNKMQPLFFDDEGREPVHIFTCSRSTGDGITMCEKLGADIDYINRRVNLFGPMRHPYPCVSLNISRSPGGVTVNSVGELYQTGFQMKEVSSLVFQPGRYCWKIVDDTMAEDTIERSMESKEKDVVNIDLNKQFVKWREILAEEVKCGSIVSADTLEDLGEKLGFDPMKFVRLIQEQNEKPLETPVFPAKEDSDELDIMASMMPPVSDIKKIEKPPFYALKMKLFHENSIGGMKTDENTNVLKNGKPIPGLYAAGDNTRGIMLPGDIGVQYIESIISALTYAFNSGYISGIEAVDYIQSY